MYFYHSVSTGEQAITFGDSKNILKPIKRLKHDWQKVKDIVFTNQTLGKLYECKKCGIKGVSEYQKGYSIIVPDKFMPCEEVIIEDILG